MDEDFETARPSSHLSVLGSRVSCLLRGAHARFQKFLRGFFRGTPSYPVLLGPAVRELAGACTACLRASRSRLHASSFKSFQGPFKP